MMMWYDGGWGWGGWILMTVAMAVLWALLITVVVLVVRYLATPRGPGSHERRIADDVLAERYARGEIDDDEYRRRLKLLHEHR